MPDSLVGHTIFSPSNRRRLEHWVWTPPGEHRDLPVVLLLHGVCDAGGFVWWQNARVHELSDALVAAGELPPFCLVMPTDTGVEQGTGWSDWRDGSCAAETYVMRELLPSLAETYPVRLDALHIGGLSMGGYGALLLALRHPGRFASASATSGFFHPRRLFTFVPDASHRIWGDAAREAEHDVTTLVLDPQRRQTLRIAFDCGTEDHLIDYNRDFTRLLRDHDIAHTYVEHPGAHTWDYWTRRVEHHLRFHLDRGGDLSTTPPAQESRPASSRTATA
jgi:S-formylglutathione hydrolase FrmB